MNCQDIAEILDNRRIAHLPEPLRREVNAHLDGCPGCARDWCLHAEFAALPGMAMPDGFPLRCRTLVASIPHAGRSRRARGRFVLIGTLVVVAAAAAMLVFAPVPADPATHGPVTRTGDDLPAAPAAADRASPPPETSSLGPVAVPAGESRFFVRVSLLVPAEEAHGALAYEDMAIRQHVSDLMNDPVWQGALAAFRDALIKELRAVPGLMLGDPSPDAANDLARPRYHVKIAPGYDKTAVGRIVQPDGRHVAVIVLAERLQADDPVAYGHSMMETIDLHGACVESTNGLVRCRDVHTVAVAAAAELRQNVFPRDVAAERQMQAQLQARVQDVSLEPGYRLRALEELLDPVRAPQAGIHVDPAVARSAMDFAAGVDPALRARIWRVIRGTGNPEFLSALMASATHDGDGTRLEAITTLGEDYARDPQARAVLQRAAQADARPLLRALAERALSGEQTWTTYVSTSLADSTRPASERVEAAIHQFQESRNFPHAYPDFTGLDAAGIDTLARLLPKAGDGLLRGEAQITDLLGALGDFHGGNPHVGEALLYFLEHGTLGRTRRIAAMELAQTRWEEPRVREALRKARASDPDPTTRNWLKQVLQGDVAAP